MSCTVAIANSPVFSPSSSSFCKHSNPFSRVPSSSATANPSSPSCSSPSSCSSLAFSTGFRGSFPDVEDGASFSSSPAPSSIATTKRKRPTRLDIPVASLGLCSPAPTPVSMGPTALEEERDGYYSVYCRRGKRRAAMEDRFSASLNIHGDPKQAFFGVYDGHGGSKAAEFAAANLEKNVMEGVLSARIQRDDDDDAVKEALRDGYLKTDSDFLKEDLRGGSCCVTALIRNGNLVVSNAGDCRAVVSRGGKAEALTTDHRPSREGEKDRIEAAGGYIDCYHGVWRIQGSLAVSRGIGDGQLKNWVIAEPETTVHRINSDSEFLILASDGLWDKVTDQEAVDIARPMCLSRNNSTAADPLSACKKLAEISVARGSFDDISVMLIQLDRYL